MNRYYSGVTEQFYPTRESMEFGEKQYLINLEKRKIEELKRLNGESNYKSYKSGQYIEDAIMRMPNWLYVLLFGILVPLLALYLLFSKGNDSRFAIGILIIALDSLPCLFSWLYLIGLFIKDILYVLKK